MIKPQYFHPQGHVGRRQTPQRGEVLPNWARHSMQGDRVDLGTQGAFNCGFEEDE